MAVPVDLTFGQLDRVDRGESGSARWSSSSCNIAQSGGVMLIVRLKGTPSRDQPLHHPEKRDVSFGDSLEEPLFLKKLLVLGMPNKRQMRVEDERERAGRHC